MDKRAPDLNRIIAWIARAILRLFGWRIDGQVPNLPKFIVVGGPHTSNWDGMLLLLVAAAVRLRLRWLGKDSLFRGPFDPLIRAFGGIPIDRKASHNAVQQIVAVFGQHERLVLVMAPEATRKKMPYWRTGFYYMAANANVPIVPVSVDYFQKLVCIGDIIEPTGDIEADFDLFRAFFKGVPGKDPDKVSEIRPRPRPTDAPLDNEDVS